MWTGKPTDDIKKLLTNKFNTNANDFCEYNPPFTTAIIPTLFKIAPTVASEIIIALWEVKSKEISVIFLRSSIFIASLLSWMVSLEMPNFVFFLSLYLLLNVRNFPMRCFFFIEIAIAPNYMYECNCLKPSWLQRNKWELNYISRSVDKKKVWMDSNYTSYHPCIPKVKGFFPSNYWTYWLVKC